MFHKSFLNILMELDPLETQEYDSLKIYSENVDDIIETSPYYLQGVKREQLLIETANNYYIARDFKTNTIYICYKNILMLDFDNIDNNHFVVTNQFYFAGNAENIRPDIIIFLNGIPIVDIEAKSPTASEQVDYAIAIGQIKKPIR